MVESLNTTSKGSGVKRILMGKKKPQTPRSKVKQALRKLSLQSRERSQAISRDKYTCQVCGVKQSKRKGHEQKVECHHKSGEIQWELIINYIFEQLLVPPEGWITLCPDCHKTIHKENP